MSASARAFLCECGGRRCRAEVRLTEAEYSELRAAGLKLIARAGHQPAAQTVVARGPGWVAVRRRRNTAQGSAAGPVSSGLEVVRCPSPTCGVETIVSDRGTCLWCSTVLVPAEAA